MKKQSLVSLIAACLLAFSAGCGKPASPSELPGTYVAEYPFATDTIVLTADHKFAQSIKINSSGSVTKTNGTWRYRAEEGDLILSAEFMVAIDGFGEMVTNFANPPVEAIAIHTVQKFMGKIQIGVDPRIPYKKQPAPAP